MVQIDEHRYGYFFCLSLAWFWFFDFVTDHPTQQVEYFVKKHFKLPLMIGRMTEGFLDVCQLTALPPDRIDTKVVRIITEEKRQAGNRPTRYMVLRSGGGYDYISEEQAAKMYKEIYLANIEEARALYAPDVARTAAHRNAARTSLDAACQESQTLESSARSYPDGGPFPL